jgi:heme oxygenase-like protein
MSQNTALIDPGRTAAPAGGAPGPDAGPLPEPRGPLSDTVTERLLGIDGPRRCIEEPVAVADPLTDDDLHLALYVCYELFYRGIRGVEDDREWDPVLLTFRSRLEREFERGLRDAISPAHVDPSSIAAELRTLARRETGPSLSRFMEREAGREQFQEFMIQRSSYHLKEADPHSFAIPRLSAMPKSALVEIQADEYGDGDPEQMHAVLFAESMWAMGLDSSYGSYLPRIAGATLAMTNLMSMFGLHRRLNGALVGHLALFELTSSIPNRRYANGLRRCRFGPAVTRFFDVHVEADAAHGAIAANDLAGSFVGADPQRAEQVSFGARALQLLETQLGSSWIRTWRKGRSTLRPGRALP